jgi:hypothetical protein
MPHAKASHCLRRISQGKPRAPSAFIRFPPSLCYGAARRRDKLPRGIRNFVAADVSRLKLLPRRNNERTDVRCYIDFSHSRTLPGKILNSG